MNVLSIIAIAFSTIFFLSPVVVLADSFSKIGQERRKMEQEILEEYKSTIS